MAPQILSHMKWPCYFARNAITLNYLRALIMSMSSVFMSFSQCKDSWELEAGREKKHPTFSVIMEMLLYHSTAVANEKYQRESLSPHKLYIYFSFSPSHLSTPACNTMLLCPSGSSINARYRTQQIRPKNNIQSSSFTKDLFV